MNNTIKVQGLNYTIPYGKEIIKDISFELRPGEFMGVLGKNGAGKTTLIDILLGVKNPSKGDVFVLGERPEEEERQNLTSICFISQDVSLKGTITIKQYLNFFADLYPMYSKDYENSLLEYFNVNPEDQIATLSTGQQKKVQIIAAISARPQLLIIDEITAVLDPETRTQFFTLLKAEKERHKMSILLATNIAEDLINRADKILFVQEGRATLEQPECILNLFNVKKSA